MSYILLNFPDLEDCSYNILQGTSEYNNRFVLSMLLGPDSAVPLGIQDQPRNTNESYGPGTAYDYIQSPSPVCDYGFSQSTPKEELGKVSNGEKKNKLCFWNKG